MRHEKALEYQKLKIMVLSMCVLQNEMWVIRQTVWHPLLLFVDMVVAFDSQLSGCYRNTTVIMSILLIIRCSMQNS